MSGRPATLPSDGETDPLHSLHACPRCQYLLHGLPDTGRCPECGGRYDKAVIVLHGYARGGRIALFNAPPWMLMLCVGCLAWGTFMHFRKGASDLPLTVLGVVFWGAILVYATLKRWNRRTMGLAGTVRVHLSAAGCAQADGDAALPRLIPWPKVRRVLLKRTFGGRRRLRMACSDGWWDSITPDAADAEVVCTHEQAEVLRARINAWRDAARLAKPTLHQPANRGGAPKA